MPGSFERVIDNVKSHPVLYASVAAVVAIYFLWPHGTAATTANTADAAAIAAAAQASSQLQLGQDQVQIAQSNAAAALAMNDANNANRLALANVAASINTVNQNAALTSSLAQTAATVHAGDNVIASQNSAQSFISDLVKAGFGSPILDTLGLKASGMSPTTTPSAATAATPQVLPLPYVSNSEGTQYSAVSGSQEPINGSSLNYGGTA